MRARLRFLISIIVIFTFAQMVSGKDSLCVKRLCHDLELAVSGGYNLPSHGFYVGHNPTGKPLYANSSLHLKYGFGFQPDTYKGNLYPNTIQGIGVAATTFYNHSLMGTPVFAYIFQKGNIWEFSDHLGLDYNFEFGGSYGWKHNAIISTDANIYVNVGLMLSVDVNKFLTLTFGPEFSHCSNGDTSFPNGGTNVVNFRLGMTGHVEPLNGESDRTAAREYCSVLREESFAQRMIYDLVIYGGWRAAKVSKCSYAPINEPFPFFAVNFIPMYRINHYFSAGASLDLLMDRSADIYDVIVDPLTDEVISYQQPGLLEQTAAGLSLKGDITFPIFTVGAGVGGFLLTNSNSLRGIYTTFSLKAFVSKRFFLSANYRLSTKNFTHNMMYGLGWRFN